MACVRKCRHSRLASRVHQNSPRTRLLASNQMMLHQRRCRLVSILKAENHPRLAKRLCVPPAQGFGAFPCVCHRPKGRLGFSGGVLPSSGQLSPSPVSVSPSGRPLSSSSSAVPASGRLRLPVVLASVQIPPLLSPVPCPVLFRLPVPLFLSPVKRRQSPPPNGTDLLCKWMCLRLRLFAFILYFIPPTARVWLSWPRICKRRCYCQFSWSLGRRFSRTSSHPGSAVS